MKKRLLYKRILLKLSGEAFMGDSSALSKDSLLKISNGIKDLCSQGVQVGIVVGGGNIFRGKLADELKFQRTPSDNMGMLATIINAIALQQSLELSCQKCVIMSAIPCGEIAEMFQWKKAIEYLENDTIVIFAGGTGSPYFTTDTAAALRASEIQAEILLKATKVNGIYSKDPIRFPNAKRYEKLSFAQVLQQKLDIMDATSIALCMQSNIPILVFDMWATQKYSKVLIDTTFGTLVHL